MNEKTQELTSMEETVIGAFKGTALGREGMMPCDVMSASGKSALFSLIDKGIIFEDKESEMTSICAGTRYLLVDEKYPMSEDDFWEYRSSGKSESISYVDFLVEKESGTWVDDSEEIQNHTIKAGELLTELTGMKLHKYAHIISASDALAKSYRAGHTPRETLVEFLADNRNISNDYSQDDINALLVEAADNGDESLNFAIDVTKRSVEVLKERKANGER